MNNTNADAVDGAHERLLGLLPELSNLVSTIQSEQDTRLKIIDPLFIGVLGWDLASITTEESAGEGFLDYKFSVDGKARLIVEAKKDSISLGTSKRSPGKSYKLNGPVLSQRPQPHGGIQQAIRYCGIKNAELACVTNGQEWIIFRGSRLGDGVDGLEGVGFIFPSLDSVRDNFKLFFDLLGRDRVENLVYRAYFQEAEGLPIRARAFSKTLRPVDGYRLLDRSALSQDLDRVMTAFFRQISGDDDPEMLANCFVITKESQIADRGLTRIADELVTKVRNLDTSESTALSEVIRRIHETQRNEFVLIVGNKGAGKSTFIDRFFRSVLPDPLRSECVITRINVGNSGGDFATVVSWLNDHLIKGIESALYGEDGPTYEELQGMYFDEYQRWRRGPHKFLYESDKLEFKKQFGVLLEVRREKQPDDHLRRLIRHIVCSRRKVPCLIFDNTDHFSIKFQESVFRYARSLYENEMCLVIIPITDKTSWQLSQQGALQSFDNQAFFLPTPLPRVVVEQRIRFIESRLLQEKKEKGTGYFFGKGIHLSLDDLQGFVACLQHVFLETGTVSKWIGQLANNDIRRCLSLSRDVVSSPYLHVDELLKAFIARDSHGVSEFDVKRAIIRKGYNYYPTGQHMFVQNIFSINIEAESTPLLGLRILRLLRDAKHHDAGGLEDYITIEQALDYLQAIGVQRRATLLCLDAMLKTGLCLSYDPTVTKIEDVRLVQLSPCGLQHLLWGSWDETYIGSMLQVTPIASEDVYSALRSLHDLEREPRWRAEVKLFLRHLLDEDALFVVDLEHPAYEGQKRLIKSLQKKIEQPRYSDQQQNDQQPTS